MLVCPEHWSEEVAAAVLQVTEEIGAVATVGEFWLTGDMSERARRELSGAGRQAVTGAREQLTSPEG